MPVDLLNKDRHLSRRGVKENDGMNQRERELRRARGEIACAECKRLKLRCDRTVPCSSCVRRGRPSICPNGISNTNHEDKGPLPDFMQVRHKFKEMSDRIRQLEDALEILQKTQSDAPHPLLSRTLLKVKNVDEMLDMPNIKKDIHAQDSDENETELALGTLTISESGISRFLGRGGGAESLILHEASSDSEDERQEVSVEVARIVNALPYINSGNAEDYLAAVLNHLPSWERASSLCEIYLEHCSWLTRPVKRDQLLNELLPAVYKRNTSSLTAGFGTQDDAKRSVHGDEIALLLMVFAIGALGDLTLPACNEDAEEFYQLARAVAVTQTLFENPTLAAVQAIILMASYISLSSRYNALDASSSMVALACSLARSMGLHRDPAQWKLDQKVINRRRNVFWELFVIDNLHGLYTGRPPILSLRYIDTEFPEDESQHIDKNGSVSPSFWHWKFWYAKKIMFPLNEIMTTVGPIKYVDILKVDSEAHAMLIIPSHLKIPPGGSSWENDSPALIMSRFITSISRDILIVHVHRAFFAKALLDFPNNPLKSPYAHSFLTAYNSAVSLLKSVRIHYDTCPALISRFWSTWSHAFSATVILGSTVIRAPTSELTPTALLEFGYAIDLFQEALNTSPRAKRAMPILLRLRDKVYRAYSRARYGSGTSDTNPRQKEWESELSILAGKTQFVATKDHIKPLIKSQRNSPSSTSTDTDSPIPQRIETPQIQHQAPTSTKFESSDISESSNNDAMYSYLATLAEAQLDGTSLNGMGYASWMSQPQAGLSNSNTVSQLPGSPPFNLPTAEQQQAFSQLTRDTFTYTTNYPAFGTNSPQYSVNMTKPPTYPPTSLNLLLNAGEAAADEAWRSLMQDSEMLMTL